MDNPLQQITRDLRANFFFRDIGATGYAALTRNQEATVLAGVASRYVDIVRISGSNTSTLAIAVDIRSGTGSGIVDTIVIPAGNTFTKNYDVPLMASEQAAAWTVQVQGSDNSDSPITISVQGVRNIRYA